MKSRTRPYKRPKPRTVVKPGDVFGRLTVVRYHGRAISGAKRWFCKCVCGETTITITASLTRGSTTSCGCYRRERMIAAGKASATHGESHTYMWRRWCAIRNGRCQGGRFVNVEADWIRGYTTFRDDILREIGPRPTEKHSLVRTDPKKGYVRDNMTWGTYG